jgi:hypothetical protein
MQASGWRSVRADPATGGGCSTEPGLKMGAQFGLASRHAVVAIGYSQLSLTS